ncbi:MAG: oxidoreductase [Nitrospirales bacterium]|nr:MAG: oxidoreductase [Nitrospirales bacterium]
MISHHFAEGLRNVPGVQLLAVGSRSSVKAEEFARQFSVLRAYGSFEELVRDKDVDVIYIATPSQFHKEHCLLCLEAGKAVLCEKPFTHDAGQAEEVISLARKKELFCMEAMWMRFLPIMGKLQKLLADNTIGDVRMVMADLGFASSCGLKGTQDYDRGKGALLDLGVYPLSLVFFLLGKPVQVLSQVSINAVGVDEQLAAIMRYPGGELGIISASKLASLSGEGLIVGTRGQIRIHAPLYRPHKLTISLSPNLGDSSKPPSSWLMRIRRNSILRAMYFRFEDIFGLVLGKRDQKIVVEPFEGNGYNYEIGEVVRCLREGHCESQVMSLDETLNIMKTLDVIRHQWR